MQMVAKLATALQRVFTTVAEDLAKECGLRTRKFSGATLAQTLVFGWLSKPAATLEALAQQAAVFGVQVSPQGVARRFRPGLATFFQKLLEAAVREVVTADPQAVELLRRFPGVFLHDSTVINLPNPFAAQWPACGGSRGQSDASLKFQTRIDYVTGRFQDLVIEPGRQADQASVIQETRLPAGSLRLADLGYFCLAVLQQLSNQGVFWISRIQPHTAVFSAQGTPRPLGPWLKKNGPIVIDEPILLGARERVACRLIAVRVPAEVRRKRLQRLEKDARRRGRPVSQRQREWTAWTILVTNLPAETFTWEEICVLYRVRWQIELLFKLWKSYNQIDKSASQNPDRILAELFAKMLGAVVQHWLLLTTVWSYGDRSLPKAVEILRSFVQNIALALSHRGRLAAVLTQMRECFRTTCKMNKRRNKPSTYQLLMNPSLLKYA